MIIAVMHIRTRLLTMLSTMVPISTPLLSFSSKSGSGELEEELLLTPGSDDIVATGELVSMGSELDDGDLEVECKAAGDVYGVACAERTFSVGLGPQLYYV
jgi:hypothetical protein